MEVPFFRKSLDFYPSINFVNVLIDTRAIIEFVLLHVSISFCVWLLPNLLLKKASYISNAVVMREKLYHMGIRGKISRLHYLKYTHNLSDDDVVEAWVENPYWQFFSGMQWFEHTLPIPPSSMCRWRKRIGDAGSGTESSAGDR